MKILYLCHRFPFPPDFGSKVRAFHTIKHLGLRHEVTVAAPVRSSKEAHAGEGLESHCHKVLTETISPAAAISRMVAGAPTSRPASMAYFDSPALRRRIREEIARTDFDLIFVHCSSVAPYVENVAGVPMILDFVDMDSQKWLDYARFHSFPRSLVYRLEGLKLQRAEAKLARSFDFCTCATQAEVDTLEGFNTETPVDWFANGVDLEYFCPDGAQNDAYDPNTIAFVGRMDYFPNVQAMVDFCSDVLPKIQAGHPGVKLTIIGADPTSAVQNLANIPGVTVTGTVPDVRPYLRGAAVSVAPLSVARGTQNKILEALALGVPVVSSQLAGRGFDAVPGEHFLSAATAEDFAAQTLRLLTDAGERRRFAEAGRARMESHHGWDVAMRRLDAIVDRVLARRRVGAARVA